MSYEWQVRLQHKLNHLNDHMIDNRRVRVSYISCAGLLLVQYLVVMLNDLGLLPT
jgi:hypothetical protein